jgi:N-acetyl sugar amidotransferase
MYCSRCVYPQISVNLSIDDDGVCSGCKGYDAFQALTPADWDRRRQKLDDLLSDTLKNNTSNYDCIIPVSGGKDSYWQTHVMTKRYGLKPLLVTYHGNNYLPEGDYNRDRMRQVFDADHWVFGPSVAVLKKLNRLCFRKMGDMNWHAHCGIVTVPFIIAAKFNIPLMIWGETSWDISGMFEPDDFVEFSARERHEHFLRGFEWYDLIGDERETLTEKDLLWTKYPSDEEILNAGVRGLYLGNYFPWEPNEHWQLVHREYGWQPAAKPFERTYRQFSNLDDRYENGIHDLLKFVKFGYGRASDHACKDIRTGHMSRDEGIAMVRKYDAVVSSDLFYWLDYVGMTEAEFWATADTFRDPRVWRIENDHWVKETIWGEPTAFGPVRLEPDARAAWERNAGVRG